MLVTVIIFLREAIEAALLFSVLLALCQRFDVERRWLFPTISTGVAGACIGALLMERITNSFDGTGQEIMNATFLFFMATCAIIICLWLSNFLRRDKPELNDRLSTHISWVFILILCLAIMHEGLELSIYCYSYMLGHDNNLAFFIGGILGLGIGISFGAIVYYILVNLSSSTLMKIAIFLLVLVAAGMSSQASLYLIQSGWLPFTKTLWDSSNIISEQSLLGQLLYAMIGYEATPDGLQVVFYFSTIAISLLSIFLYARRHRI